MSEILRKLKWVREATRLRLNHSDLDDVLASVIGDIEAMQQIDSRLRARVDVLAAEWTTKAEEAVRLSKMAALGDEEDAMLDISIELLNSHAAELRDLLREERKESK